MSRPPISPHWKILVRVWICVLFLVLSAADYLLLRFGYDADNPRPEVTGVFILSALCTKLLLIAMWRRTLWSRSALATILVISITAVSVLLFFIVGGKMPHHAGMLKNPLAGVALQILALIPLAHSRSIRRHLHPLTHSD